MEDEAVEVVSDDGDFLLRRSSSSQATDPESQIPLIRQTPDWTPKEKRTLQYTTAGLIAYFMVGSVAIAML